MAFRAACSCLIGFVCLGCGKDLPAPSSPSPPGQPAPATDRPVELTDITLAGLDEFVAKQKGKVVLSIAGPRRVPLA